MKVCQKSEGSPHSNTHSKSRNPSDYCRVTISAPRRVHSLILLRFRSFQGLDAGILRFPRVSTSHCVPFGIHSGLDPTRLGVTSLQPSSVGIVEGLVFRTSYMSAESYGSRVVSGFLLVRLPPRWSEHQICGRFPTLASSRTFSCSVLPPI